MSKAQERLQDLKLVGGASCLDFANTDDLLRDYEDLLIWALHASVLDAEHVTRLRRVAGSDPRRAEAAFKRAIRLRRTIRRLLSGQAAGRPLEEGDLADLSSVVAKAATHLRLRTTTCGVDWHWHGADDRLDWPIWRVARSAADLLLSEDRERVRECSGRNCNWLFIDTSRNRSRRWCDMAVCGNREKARRNYARSKQAG
jgi:predicted RNA-binding Zn ribbon-like protein